MSRLWSRDEGLLEETRWREKERPRRMPGFERDRSDAYEMDQKTGG